MAFFPSLKQNFIAYRSSKVSDCIFEIHQLWQSGFSRVYSNYCCSCSFKAEIIKIGQSSYKMYSNNIVNFQESTIILNACTKVWKVIEGTTYIYVCIYTSRWNPRGVVAYVVDCNIVVNEFEFHSCYYFNFRINTFSVAKKYKENFGITNPRRLICHLRKKPSHICK